MFRSCASICASPPTKSAQRTGKGDIAVLLERALILRTVESRLKHSSATEPQRWFHVAVSTRREKPCALKASATLARLVTRGPRSTEALVRGGAATPTNHDSTLQPEAVLVVVVAAKCCFAAIAKTCVEIFGLDRAQGKLLVYFDVKSPAYRQGESVLRIGI